MVCIQVPNVVYHSLFVVSIHFSKKFKIFTKLRLLPLQSFLLPVFLSHTIYGFFHRIFIRSHPITSRFISICLSATDLNPDQPPRKPVLFTLQVLTAILFYDTQVNLLQEYGFLSPLVPNNSLKTKGIVNRYVRSTNCMRYPYHSRSLLTSTVHAIMQAVEVCHKTPHNVSCSCNPPLTLQKQGKRQDGQRRFL